jgi:hypothetical protein
MKLGSSRTGPRPVKWGSGSWRQGWNHGVVPDGRFLALAQAVEANTDLYLCPRTAGYHSGGFAEAGFVFRVHD